MGTAARATDRRDRWDGYRADPTSGGKHRLTDRSATVPMGNDHALASISDCVVDAGRHSETATVVTTDNRLADVLLSLGQNKTVLVGITATDTQLHDDHHLRSHAGCQPASV